jgi:hypothetical protein
MTITIPSITTPSFATPSVSLPSLAFGALPHLSVPDIDMSAVMPALTEVGSAISSAAEGASVTARSVGHWARRHPRLVVGAGIGVVLVATASAAARRSKARRQAAPLVVSAGAVDHPIG